MHIEKINNNNSGYISQWQKIFEFFPLVKNLKINVFLLTYNICKYIKVANTKLYFTARKLNNVFGVFPSFRLFLRKSSY